MFCKVIATKNRDIYQLRSADKQGKARRGHNTTHEKSDATLTSRYIISCLRKSKEGLLQNKNYNIYLRTNHYVRIISKQ